MSDEFTPEEIAAMSDEERKALIEDTGPVPGDPATLESQGPVEDEGEAILAPTPVASSEEQPAVGGEMVVPSAGVPAAPSEPAATGQEPAVRGAPDHAKPFVPLMETRHTPDEIKKSLADLNKQYEEGELDTIAYLDQRDALRDELSAISHNQNLHQQLWQHEQSIFYDQNPEFSPNEGKGNPVLFGALKHMFAKLDADPANGSKGGYQLLTEAKQQVLDNLGKVDVRASSGGGAVTTSPSSATPKPSPALQSVEIPKTLGGLPIAQAGEVGQDEFAQIDNLTGLDYEKALSRLTPEQERRYLQRSQ